jgi:hypothetical protein
LQFKNLNEIQILVQGLIYVEIETEFKVFKSKILNLKQDSNLALNQDFKTDSGLLFKI